ncbi:DUF2254 domain-containing protein [Marivita sp. S0852]|uniref:DUF2254 domain-containing protein n=1 Tax=Marivita sp. S0852 TaxID=3373893 RepID=UPI0039821B55
MRERIWLWIKRLWHRPGFRISAFGATALLAALVAPLVDRSLPDALVERFSREAVLPVLNILASSMLAVTTFSLGNMVQAFRSAAGQATPRVYQLLMQDMTTLNVMSIFVGAFLFSLVSIVMFQTGFYGDTAAVVVSGLTMVCIVMIVIAMLRWIAHLSQLGSLHHTLSLVEAVAKPPLERLADEPNFGARPASHSPRAPEDARPLYAPKTGFVQFISVEELNSQLETEDATLWVFAPPGRWVLKGTPLAFVDGDFDTEGLLGNFTLGDERTAEQDARFGLVILSEVASRALSPGVNDPGTAIDVIHRVERILWDLGQRMCNEGRDTTIHYPRVIIGSVSAENLIQDGYSTLMEDGGDRFDVMAQVLKATSRLSQSEWPELAQAAEAARDSAFEIIDRRIDNPSSVATLREKAAEV